MLIPAQRLLWFCWLSLILAVGVSLDSSLLKTAGIASAVFLSIIMIDGLILLRRQLPTLQRHCTHSMALGIKTVVVIRLHNSTLGHMQLVCHDNLPDVLQTRQLPQSCTIAAGTWAELSYEVLPTRRGEYAFAQVQGRLSSRLGFWWRQWSQNIPQTVRVYPDFKALTRYALLATDHRLSQIGVLRRRRRGSGSDFRQLREYREGDAQRQIDWKATSRLRKLISREYQDERDQQIVFLLDCGRKMSTQDGDLSHLDHTLNAALLLSYVAIRQGDAVGLMTMSGPERWLAPRKTTDTIHQLLNQVFDLQPSFKTSDYRQTAQRLMQHLKKRALVVILTNLRDEDDEALSEAVTVLQRHHLVLVASLRENFLTQTITQPVDNLDQALLHAAAADYLQRRQRARDLLQARRVLCIEEEPERLAMALVNGYIDLKRSGRL